MPIYDSIQLLGMTIDRDLMFLTYIWKLCSRINNQVSVLPHLRNFVSIGTRCRLYKAFSLPYFRYYCSVMHFCCSSDIEKLELVNKRASRAVYNNQALTYEQLLQQIGQCSLNDMHFQDHLLFSFKIDR